MSEHHHDHEESVHGHNDHHDHDDHLDHDGHHDKEKETHAEIKIKREYEFRKDTKIHGMSTGIFVQLPDINGLTFSCIRGEKQRYYRLNHQK